MLSVLIVDDQVQIRQLIRDALEGAGYHVERLVTEKRDLSATANNPPPCPYGYPYAGSGRIGGHYGVPA